MPEHVEYKHLLVVVPHDFGPPIYYSPPEDMTLFFSQTLSAILLGLRELDEEQIGVGLKSLRLFFDQYRDRRMLYSGGGALLVLPDKYRDRESYLDKLKELFKAMNIPLHVRYWQDFGLDFTVSLFAIDLSLRSDMGILSFIMNNLEEVKKWQIKANEYKETGVIFIGPTKL